MRQHVQLAIPLHGIGISLVIISNGQVGFTRTANFPLTFDMNNEVVISESCLLVQDESYVYNRAYTISEKLKKWLVSLELEQPY